jgi:predicted nucleic acid-binding protein
VADAVVLDTSACFALLENEPGADIVETFLLDARAEHRVVHASFASLTEIEYIIIQERCVEDATAALLKIKEWPMRWHHTDDDLCSEAAKLKAAHNISFADAFVAATALRLNAVLVHKDPEFDALAATIKLHPLPPKIGAT